MSNIKFMVVDDEEVFFCPLLRRFCQKKVTKSSSATNGQEALEKLSKNEVDVIILDVKMPVMDGIDRLEGNQKTLSLGGSDFIDGACQCGFRYSRELISGLLII